MEKEPLKFLSLQKVMEQEDTLRLLDALRKTRKLRGGTGAPLIVPTNLKEERSNTLFVTDADDVIKRS